MGLESENMRHLDIDEATHAINVFLKAFGFNTTTDTTMSKTPARVAKAYAELFGGLYEEPPDISLEPKEECDEMIILKDIDFVSVCKHHLLPFRGRCSIAYLPKESIVGLSKLPRIVHYWAKRPQLQEALSNQIANFIMEKVEPLGVMVIIKGYHECVACRGIRERDSAFLTSAIRGIFTEQLVKTEAISLLGL